MAVQLMGHSYRAGANNDIFIPPASVTGLPSDKANKDIDLLVNQEGNSTCSECGKEGMILM